MADDVRPDGAPEDRPVDDRRVTGDPDGPRDAGPREGAPAIEPTGADPAESGPAPGDSVSRGPGAADATGGTAADRDASSSGDVSTTAATSAGDAQASPVSTVAEPITVAEPTMTAEPTTAVAVATEGASPGARTPRRRSGARRTRRPAAASASPRSSSRRAVATGARIATGVVVAAVAAATVTAAFLVPLPSVTAAPASVTVDPAPAEEVRACPGPFVRLSDESGQDATAISGVGSPGVRSAASSPDATLDTSALLSPDDRTTTATTAPQRIALPAAEASGDAGVLFAAAQAQQVAEGDLVGYAAAACGEATSDSWLVAGATTVGRTSFVLLANPGDVAAVVDIAIFGGQGPVTTVGSNNIDVPARSTRILSLAGLAPDLAAPVVHVTASVGAVTAALQQSVVRGLAPGGVELAGSAAAATSQSIAGIQVSGTSSIAEQLGSPDTADLQSVLRMLAPGADPASVTVRVAEERTGGTQTEYQVGLTPGVVTEFPLQDIPDGTYSVTLDSDQPVVAGARTTSIVNGATDFAWYQPVQALASPFFVAVPDGPAPRLHLVNSTDTNADVVLTEPDGSQTTVTFMPGARSVAVESGSYTVTSTQPVGAVVTFAGAGALSSFAIVPPGPEASPITVYP